MLNSAKTASFISAYKAVDTTSHRYGPLSAHSILYKVGGITEYFHDDVRIVASPGKLVFMPKGAEFNTRVIEPGEFMEISYSSSVVPEQGLGVYSDFGAAEMEKAFRDMLSLYAEPDNAAYFNCQIQLNRIFALVAKSSEESLTGHERRLLAPALDYLKANIFDPGFSVAKMASTVNMSDTYFRMLFVRIYHMSPKSYVISERIQLAKALLADNPLSSVQHIAEAVGYTDALYFSRIFKKTVGESPAQYVEKVNRLQQ